MRQHTNYSEGCCCVGCGKEFDGSRKRADWQTVGEYPCAGGAKAITAGPVCIDCALARREPAVIPDEDSRHHHYHVELAEGVAVEFTAPAIRPGDALALMCEWHPAIPAHISAAMREQYRDARDTFIQQVRAASELASARIVEPDIGNPAV